jgi:hypothetical protein
VTSAAPLLRSEHTVDSDFGSATAAQRTHCCASLAKFAIFITLLTATFFIFNDNNN